MPSTNSDLQRAQAQIEPAIKAFCRTRFQTNPIWFMSDLVRYVTSYPGMKCAPASPGRILRNMRAQGKIDYIVINRAKSLYRINMVS